MKMKIPKVKKPSQKILAKVHSLKKEKGKIAVIEPDSGEYFLGKTLLEALNKAEAKYPNKIFYSIRIGYPFAHQLNGAIRKVIFNNKTIETWFVPGDWLIGMEFLYSVGSDLTFNLKRDTVRLTK
jgi:hypothetical protein